MRQHDRQPPQAGVVASAPAFALWALVAAFGTYFCMYVFRKPFTAATYADSTIWGIGEKTALVTAQVLGYTASKVLGIRVIAETPPDRRALGILVLIGGAEAALLLFGVVPSPWHVVCLFLNGMSLGMVFGLVLGFLEGRRGTEALAAGLCASFILADGVAKSVGTWLLDQGVNERWMPGIAGLLFFPPLLVFVGMLSRIKPPDERDVELRGERQTMDRHHRAALLGPPSIGADIDRGGLLSGNDCSQHSGGLHAGSMARPGGDRRACDFLEFGASGRFSCADRQWDERTDSR